MSWQLKRFEALTADELYNILKERVDVFVVEQACPYPEVDGHDKVAYHLYQEQNGEIIAYLRILPAGSPHPHLSIGRVLVKKNYRGQGMATELLQRALDFIQHELKETMVFIQAQEYLQEFYTSFGFQPISETYLEDHIPHLDMILSME